MLSLCYRAITVFVAVLVALELFRQKELKLKFNAAIVLIPLIMRALMLA